MSANSSPLIKYSICVSGAASGDTVAQSSGLAMRIGKAVARRGHVTVTGATVGLPYYAAQGATLEGGMSIGYSPASTVREHARKYRLPLDSFDYIYYTGTHYMGRDISMVQSCDAIILVGGRFGTLNEFIIALEEHKPIGILTSSGGASDIIEELLKVLEPPRRELIIFDDNPESLVESITQHLNIEMKDLHADLIRERLSILKARETNRQG